MSSNHSSRMIVALSAAIALVTADTAGAEGPEQWPQRPVRLIVPFGAGGAADALARNLANGFPQFANGHPLIVENRAGAGGTIGAAAAAREKPDGYTLLLAEVGPNAAAHKLMAKLPYDPHKAFSPIIRVADLPAVVLVRPTLPYKTLDEFVAAAKRHPGKFNYASAGIGNWTHLFMAYFNSRAGIDQVNIAYRSGAEMLTSLIRNDADTAILTISTSLGQVREGKVRALAGTSRKPMPQLPNTPSVAHTLEGFDVSVWHGIVGPVGMNDKLIAHINRVFNQVLEVSAVRTAIIEAQAAEIVGGTPQEFDAFIKSELSRWPQVVMSAGIKL